MSVDGILPAPGTSPGNASTQAPVFFSLSDRIGRLRYFSYTLIAMVGCCLLLAVIYLFALLLPATLGKLISVSCFILVKNVVIPLIVFVMSIRRLHDLNANGWWALTILIPLVTLILLALPGQREANRFGPPPAPNPGRLIATALTLPVALLAFYFWMVDINASMKLSAKPAVTEGGTHQPLRSYDQK